MRRTALGILIVLLAVAPAHAADEGETIVQAGETLEATLRLEDGRRFVLDTR